MYIIQFFQIFKRRAIKYKVKFKKKLAQRFVTIFYFRIKNKLEIVARHFGSLTELCLQQHEKNVGANTRNAEIFDPYNRTF